MAYWKKTIFWENVKRSLATFSGPTFVGMHEFGAADGWIMAAGAIGMLTGILSIWLVDQDNNGIVDIFQ